MINVKEITNYKNKKKSPEIRNKSSLYINISSLLKPLILILRRSAGVQRENLKSKNGISKPS